MVTIKNYITQKIWDIQCNQTFGWSRLRSFGGGGGACIKAKKTFWGLDKYAPGKSKVWYLYQHAMPDIKSTSVGGGILLADVLIGQFVDL